MKAFLSHSSSDKEFVRAVANELKRQFCIFDEQVFSTGDELKAVMQKGIDNSEIFVLFASKASLQSIWVNFEVEEAWLRSIHGAIIKSLVYIIDSSIAPNDLPEWLRRAIVRRETSPKLLARDIKYHLDDLSRKKQSPYFVGRNKDIDEIQRALVPLDGSVPPKALFVAGLPGIGRRTLISHIAPTSLNFKKQSFLKIGEGDSINDICINVASQVEPYSTKEGFERIVGNIRRLSDTESSQRILSNLSAMNEAGELPSFLDDGGLLDDEGYLREPVKKLLRDIQPPDNIYLFFISSRRPKLTYDFPIPVISLNPLSEVDTKILVKLLSDRASLTINPSELNELAPYIAGYPPSAHFVVQQAKYYGLSLVMREKARLVQFRTTVFIAHLSKYSFDETDAVLLRVLAGYSPLPLPVLAKVTNQPPEKIYENIYRLIDLALIVPTQDGHYSIADPVVDASVKTFGFPTEEQNKNIARALSSFIVSNEASPSLLSMSRVLFRAALLSDDGEISKTAIHLANDLIRLTESTYHERNYEKSEVMGHLAIKERPDSVTARSFLIRSLIQLEKYAEALDQIQQLKRYAPLRDVYFLHGFLERKRRQYTSAIENYEKSIEHGRSGASVHRELAFCYLLINDLDKALKHITDALGKKADDPYVLDLWSQIALKLGNEKDAREALKRLEVLNERGYYLHRLSRVELTFGNTAKALEAARDAVKESERPHFEILAHLVTCEIETGNIKEAEKLLKQIDNQFGNLRRDIRTSLRCRYEIATGKYSDALAMSERIVDKSTIYYKKIRHDALQGELKYSALKDKDREIYEAEIQELAKELSNYKTEILLPIEVELS